MSSKLRRSPRDRVERDGVLLDHGRSHRLPLPLAFPIGNVPVTSVPMKLPWTTPLTAVDPDAPVAGDQVARAGLGAAHDQSGPRRVEARPARDAAAAVPEGVRARDVGADQVALRPSCRCRAGIEEMSLTPYDTEAADVARNQVAGGRRRPADRVAARSNGDPVAGVGVRVRRGGEARRAGGIGADVVPLDQVCRRSGPYAIDADLHPPACG